MTKIIITAPPINSIFGGIRFMFVRTPLYVFLSREGTAVACNRKRKYQLVIRARGKSNGLIALPTGRYFLRNSGKLTEFVFACPGGISGWW
jgi:hypothetical protein